MVSFSIMRSRLSFSMRPSASTRADVARNRRGIRGFFSVFAHHAFGGFERFPSLLFCLWGAFWAHWQMSATNFSEPFGSETVFEGIEICALFAKRYHFSAECVYFGLQAVRHDEVFIEVVRFASTLCCTSLFMSAPFSRAFAGESVPMKGATDARVGNEPMSHYCSRYAPLFPFFLVMVAGW